MSLNPSNFDEPAPSGALNMALYPGREKLSPASRTLSKPHPPGRYGVYFFQQSTAVSTAVGCPRGAPLFLVIGSS